MYKIYKNMGNLVIIRQEDNASIPFDPKNTDYQAYLAWVAQGNEAEEWNPGGI
jgi:hypothetical protein